MRRTPTIDNKVMAFIGMIATLLTAPAVGRSFSLNPNTDVGPRIFSPNGDGINDMVFFNIDNSAQTQVSGVVIDMTGAHVASLAPVQNFIPSAESLMWNGKDDNGNAVPPGPYVYRIDGDGATVSGIVVVVR